VSLPTTPWFEGDELESYLARSAFDAETEAVVRALAVDGYAAVDLGDTARAVCDRVIIDTDGYFAKGAVRVQDAWYRSAAVRELATWPTVRRLLVAAYGREPVPFQTLNFRQGSQQALHTDTIHFHSVPERFMCGVWIALEDVAFDAGPLIYHPGSHRMPVMTMRDAGVNGPRPEFADYDRYFVPRLAERIAASGLPEARALLKKGWAIIWAANLAHGGAPIEAPGSTRRSLVVHNFFEDCLYFTPRTSDVEGGRLDLRIPPNLRTGRWEWPRRNGRPAMPSPRRIAAAMARAVLRQPNVG
jgi:hypothetical protein